MGEEIKIGSVSVPESSHKLLTDLVFDDSKPDEDRPFTAIVEAFRFAFALGFSLERRSKRLGTAVTVAPRQFVVSEYEVILRETCIEEGLSLGALCSDYAEGGCEVIREHLETGGSVLELV